MTLKQKAKQRAERAFKAGATLEHMQYDTGFIFGSEWWQYCIIHFVELKRKQQFPFLQRVGEG